jgi:Trypsin-co-occurring domain 1
MPKHLVEFSLKDQGIIQVEFGIKLSATAGAFLASMATESNFRVNLPWKHVQK